MSHTLLETVFGHDPYHSIRQTRGIPSHWHARNNGALSKVISWPKSKVGILGRADTNVRCLQPPFLENIQCIARLSLLGQHVTLFEFAFKQTVGKLLNVLIVQVFKEGEAGDCLARFIVVRKRMSSLDATKDVLRNSPKLQRSRSAFEKRECKHTTLRLKRRVSRTYLAIGRGNDTCRRRTIVEKGQFSKDSSLFSDTHILVIH